MSGSSRSGSDPRRPAQLGGDPAPVIRAPSCSATESGRELVVGKRPQQRSRVRQVRSDAPSRGRADRSSRSWCDEDRRGQVSITGYARGRGEEDAGDGVPVLYRVHAAALELTVRTRHEVCRACRPTPWAVRTVAPCGCEGGASPADLGRTINYPSRRSFISHRPLRGAPTPASAPLTVGVRSLYRHRVVSNQAAVLPHSSYSGPPPTLTRTRIPARVANK